MTRARRAASATGQAQAEYVVVVAALAVACIVAVVFFGGALTGFFSGSASKPDTWAPSGTLTPPSTPVPPPTEEAECGNPGFAYYGFPDRDACIAAVRNPNP